MTMNQIEQNEEYHPEYSSACMKRGCSFCSINKIAAERILRFIHNTDSKTGRLSQKQIERRQMITLGHVCKPKLHTSINDSGIGR